MRVRDGDQLFSFNGSACRSRICGRSLSAQARIPISLWGSAWPSPPPPTLLFAKSEWNRPPGLCVCGMNAIHLGKYGISRVMPMPTSQLPPTFAGYRAGPTPAFVPSDDRNTRPLPKSRAHVTAKSFVLAADVLCKVDRIWIQAHQHARGLASTELIDLMVISNDCGKCRRWKMRSRPLREPSGAADDR